jgi:MFS family permease
MFRNLIEFQSLKALTTDGRLLFGTRTVRLFAYGFLSVILALYLTQLGLTDQQIGLLLTLTLVGDAIISLWMAAVADRIGRRRMLILGAGLMIFAGLVFALTRNMVLLTLAAIIGTISPSGSEVGPFLSIEQAALPQTVPNKYRTQIFAWYNLIGSFATALGSFSGGLLVEILQRWGSTPLNSYRAVVIGYALLGAGLGLFFAKLSPGVEVKPTQLQGSGEIRKATAYRFGLHRSRKVVLKLSLLFMLDSFAGSLVVQSLIAYWFHIRFGVEPAILGSIFFGANVFAGLSALVAARMASRFGLINTMVFTHIPSNILLILVPVMPDLTSAIIVLLLRFSISQMDVPTNDRLPQE